MLLATIGLTLLSAGLAYFLYVYWARTRKYQGIVDVEAERKRIFGENEKLLAEVKRRQSEWRAQAESYKARLDALSGEVVRMEDSAEMQSFGIYEPEFDFDSADEFKEVVKEIRANQKEMVRAKTAAVCPTDWAVEGSKVKGRQMINRQLRLMLRAFNGEADVAIAKAKYNNVTRMEERIKKAHTAIDKLGESQNCRITRDYLALKIQELHLYYEMERKKQEEKEEQREIRAQMREEAKAQQEMEREQNEALKEEARYQKALEKAHREIAEAEGHSRSALETQIAELELQLARAHERGERAKSRAEMTKSGHVYVISNVGSFGDQILKIGMTRRLDPFDRVKELGDASVPFPFDVHAMIYSADAPELENLLHRRFADRRLNLVNRRREFFDVTIDEVAGVVHEQDAEIHITKAAEAAQFRESRSIREAVAKKEAEVPGADIAAQAMRELEAMQVEWSSLDLDALRENPDVNTPEA